MENPQGDQGSGRTRGHFSYGEIARSALGISWRNKFLWFFGLFVSGGLFNIITNVPSNFGGAQQNQNLPGFDQLFSNLASVLASGGAVSPTGTLALQAGPGGGAIALAIAAVVLALVVAVVLIALIFISKGGLAASVAAIDGGEGSRFGAAWRAGLSNFWRVLLQAILLFLISLGLLIVILAISAIPVLLTFLLSQSVGLRVAMSVVFALLGVLLFVAVFIPFTIISQLAVRELVVGRNGVFGSIGASYRLLRRDLGRGLLVWLINIGLKILVGIATLVVFFLLGLVFVGPGIAVSASGSQTTGVALGIIGAILLLIPVLVITGATSTYFYTYWTLAYLRLSGIEGASAYAPENPQSPHTNEETGDDDRGDRTDEQRDS